MKRQEFIADLVNLLIKIDKGMAEFETPLPLDAEKGIMQAITSFGEESLPNLHNALTQLGSQTDLVHVIDVLGIIGHTSSTPYLIEFHSQHASFMSGTAAIQAMKNIRSEEIYIYLGTLITEQASGKNVFNTGAEIPLACKVLGEWNDERAILFLQHAVSIQNPNHMPETAIRQLTKFPSAHPFLHELAQRKKMLKDTIEKAFRDVRR